MSTVLEAERGFAQVWERTMLPDRGDLEPEAARFFLKAQFTEEDRERMNQLAAKARSGSLTDQEAVELENFMQLGCFLDLMKSKARRSLRITPSVS
jgi:hypothetical protein